MDFVNEVELTYFIFVFGFPGFHNVFRMAHPSLWNSYIDIPLVTRAYTSACVLTTLAVVCIYIAFSNCSENFDVQKWAAVAVIITCVSFKFQHMELVSPYDLYFNPYLIYTHHQVS